MIGEGEQVIYEFTLGARWRQLRITTLALPFAGIAVITGIIAGFGTLWFAATLGATALVAGIAFVYYQLYIPKANSYALTNKRIIIHLGWLNTHTTTIDYAKITDVSITQSFTDRILTNTGTIHVNTAGTIGHEVVLTHIENPFEVKRKLGEVV